MPLYEYQCPTCGRFEVIRKFSDEPLEACPTCGKTIQKLLSAPAIQFKGTGWYVTDYAKKSSGGESGSSKTAETKSEPSAKSDTKSETKSETKADTKASGGSSS